MAASDVGALPIHSSPRNRSGNSTRNELRIESQLSESGVSAIAGVDEAGRGPCAGPLVIAAVIFADVSDPLLEGIGDSKALSQSRREELYEIITSRAAAYSIIEISPREVDLLGLHKSNLEGMRRVVAALSMKPDFILTDGYPIDGLSAPTLAVWKGDQVSLTIGAASILAKVHRDCIMVKLDEQYPQYGFAQHKGYITARHTAALNEFGITPEHRRSFANIKLLTASL